MPCVPVPDVTQSKKQCVQSDESEMQRIKSIVEDRAGCTPSAVAAVSTADVVSAVKKVKQKKSDGGRGFMSNHLIFGGHSYFQEIAALMTAMFIHGVQPEELLKASIVSIPKNYSKSLSDSTNYRGIALCNSLSKVVDLIILDRNRSALWTSDLQFAFKEGMSTSMCTLLLKEVVNHYRSMKSNVYTCFLDATKAFDRVRFDRLFDELINRKVSMPDLRLLLHLYTKQRIRTTWRSTASSYFSVANGIRQGSIASPVLFCVYLNALMEKLKDTGIGCWMGRNYCGVMVYADDITLLSPSLGGLKRMLKQCEHFCRSSDVQFNATKSVAVCFGATSAKRLQLPCLSFCGGQVEWADHVKHLGNFISYNLSEQKEIETKRGDLVGRVNFVLARYGGLPTPILRRIFNSQCCHFYGAQAWLLSDPAVNRFHTMYNRCLRRIFQLPATTHTRYLPLINRVPSSINQVSNRCQKIEQSMISIDNPTVRSVTRMLLSMSHSILKRNSVYRNSLNCNPLTDDDLAIVTAIVELINDDTVFEEREATEFANFLCTL